MIRMVYRIHFKKETKNTFMLSSIHNIKLLLCINEILLDINKYKQNVESSLLKKYIYKSLQMFKSRYKTFFGIVKVLQKCHMPYRLIGKVFLA